VRRCLSATLVVAALGLAALGLGGGSVAGASSGAPSRLLVKGFEFDLTLSRSEIDHGPAIVDFENTGEDPHNLVIQKVGGGPKHKSEGHTQPDSVSEIELRFRPGKRYVLYCSLGHHRAKGMEAHIGVSG
jgi:plastocyanin